MTKAQHCLKYITNPTPSILCCSHEISSPRFKNSIALDHMFRPKIVSYQELLDDMVKVRSQIDAGKAKLFKCIMEAEDIL